MGELGRDSPAPAPACLTYWPCQEAALAWPGDFTLRCSLTLFCQSQPLELPTEALTEAENTAARTLVWSLKSHTCPLQGLSRLLPDQAGAAQIHSACQLTFYKLRDHSLGRWLHG